MVFKTKMFRDLAALDVECYGQFLLFIENQDKFFSNVKALKKCSLECYLNLLLLYLQNGSIRRDQLKLDLETIIILLKREKEDTFMLLLNIFAVTSLISDEADVKQKFRKLIVRFNLGGQNYEVLRIMILMCIERECLLQEIKKVDLNVLLRDLNSETKATQVKSMECVSILIEINNEIVDEIILHLLRNRSRYYDEQMAFILCQLMEILGQNSDNLKHVQSLMGNDFFWNIIEQNCLSTSKLVRKQSLAYIRKGVEILQTSNMAITTKLFQWNSHNAQEIVNNWDYFVTIIECLNEAQSHLILPALKMMELITVLRDTWKILLIKLILAHDNTTVSTWAVNYVIHNHCYTESDTDFQKEVLAALNKTYLYTDDIICQNSLLSYYLREETLYFFFHNVKEVNFESVPFLVIVEISQSLWKQFEFCSERYDEILVGFFSFVDLCRSMKNLGLREYTAALLCKIILEILTDYGPVLKTPKLKWLKTIQAIAYMSPLSLTENKDKVQRVLHSMEKKDVFEFLPVIKPTDRYIIKEILTPCFSFHPEYALMIQERYHLTKAIVQTEMWKDVGDLNDELFVTLIRQFNERFECFQHNLDISSTIIDSMILEELLNCATLFPRELPVNKLTVIFEISEAFLLDECQADFLGTLKALETFRLFTKFMWDAVDDNSQKLEQFQLHKFVASIHYPPSVGRDIPIKIYHRLADLYVTMSMRQESFMRNKLEDCFQLVDISDVGILQAVIKIFSTILERELDQIDVLKKLIDRIYREIENYRRSEHFLDLTGRFIEAMLKPFLTNHEIWMDEVILPYWSLLMDDAIKVNGFANIMFAKVLAMPAKLLISWDMFENILLSGLLFGCIPNKDDRIEDENFVKRAAKHLTYPIKPATPILADANVRAQCVMFLVKLQQMKDIDSKQFQLELNVKLQDKFAGFTKSKERYYADSMTHRFKLRAVQAMCVIYKNIHVVPVFLLDVLLNETNQHSISYLIEFVVADSVIDMSVIADHLNRKEKLKTSTTQSIFMIIWLKCCKSNDLPCETIELLLPWTMAQHFSTRLYAQMVISKLIEKFWKQPETCPYGSIYKAINSYFRQGNTEKNFLKCSKDFRFNNIKNFNQLLTFENIFVILPKLTKMPFEEVMTCDLLELNAKIFNIEKFDVGCSIDTSTIEAMAEDVPYVPESINYIDNIQKKIVPLKHVKPDMEMITTLPETLRFVKEEEDDGLIVVASLVSRLPNLGGLARTCEIFAVKQFVMNSIQDMDKLEFQALSMTAEKWVNIGELKSFRLIQYILEMKRKGYVIVGAEQTMNSQPIENISFPVKSILILGHEKEGLPANIISYLDVIGEIPQFGVVRSLNVHVTGAIFMWEYSKQHRKKPVTEDS